MKSAFVTAAGMIGTAANVLTGGSAYLTALGVIVAIGGAMALAYDR
ncbi:MAG TPA: hypothetical protein PLO23_10200 [Alphaproteobacteria bacterium]|nr:hypothetical protein [Alphaproteobacteria bacterium]